MGTIRQNALVTYDSDIVDALQVLSISKCTSVKCENCALYVFTGHTYRCIKSLAHNSLRNIEVNKRIC